MLLTSLIHTKMNENNQKYLNAVHITSLKAPEIIQTDFELGGANRVEILNHPKFS